MANSTACPCHYVYTLELGSLKSHRRPCRSSHVFSWVRKKPGASTLLLLLLMLMLLLLAVVLILQFQLYSVCRLPVLKLYTLTWTPPHNALVKWKWVWWVLCLLSIFSCVLPVLLRCCIAVFLLLLCRLLCCCVFLLLLLLLLPLQNSL